jgi:deoxyadenosine/deoxycytidine kinase
MVKIAFSGIPTVGKTSVLAEVKKILALKFHVEEAEDVARASPFDVDAKSGFVSQFFFLTTQINEENIRAMNHPDILLCDRSILDQWVYWKRTAAQKEANGNLEGKTRLLRTIFQFWIPTYSLIFHVRTDPRILKARKDFERGTRVSPEEMRGMEEMFLDTITQEQLKVADVWNHQSVDESAQQVMIELSNLKII